MDRQLLHYYCCQAAWNLSSCADPTLWTELILRRANHQPVIRNALVALSSLHKDYLCGELVGIETDAPAPYAATQPVANLKTMGMISRCHRQLKNYLSRTDAAPDVALACSVIFYTFESLLGESQRAIWHLDQGLILLRKCQLDKSFDPDDALIPHLSTLLQHLDLQASCFDDRRPPVLKLATDAETKGHVDIVPDTFTNLSQAEAVLTKLQNWVLHHLVDYVHYRGASVEDLPSESIVERLVLAGQFQKFGTVLDRFSSYESMVSSTSNQMRQEDHRQQRTQRILLLRINLHTFSYLTKENIPLLTADAREMARKVMGRLPGYRSANLTQLVLVGVNSEIDLESALAAMETLLSQRAPGPLGASQDACAASPPRTYTLSTHLIGTLYFLSLKTTNIQILNKAISLFSHPQLRYARDGLWDARTAGFLVANLVRVRQNGYVTEGHDASDILMHVCKQDMGPNIAELQRIFSMSERTGLPMMQSKKFTLVLRNDTSRPHQEAPTTNYYSSVVTGNQFRSSQVGQTADAGIRSVGHFTQLLHLPKPVSAKEASSEEHGLAVPEVPSEDADRSKPDYVATRVCTDAVCMSCRPVLDGGEDPSIITPQSGRSPGRSSTLPVIPSAEAVGIAIGPNTMRSQSDAPLLGAFQLERLNGVNRWEKENRRGSLKATDTIAAATTTASPGHWLDAARMMTEKEVVKERQQPYYWQTAEATTGHHRTDSRMRNSACSGYEEKNRPWEIREQRSYIGAG